jgi:predicted nuclease with TOPRIM domain
MCIVAHDIFLSKIMNKDYLGKSEIVEAFIRNPGKFSLNTFIYKSSNYSAIAEKFEDSFKEDLEYQTNTDTIIHLHEAREKIVKVLKTTENLGRMIRKNCATVDGLKKISQDLNKEFYIVQQWLKSGTEEKMLDFGDFNPSQNIEIWFLSQKETYDGVIEAIYSIDELIKIREHTDSNINSTSIELNKLALGKRTFASFISKSEDIMKRKHQQLDELNTKLKALDIIIPIISSKLLHVDVPDIERNHSQSFKGEIKGFLDMLAGKIGDVRKTLLKS